MGDLAYWPTGSAFCIFFGPTPMSRGSEIRPASPVNVFGRVPVTPRAFEPVRVRDGGQGRARLIPPVSPPVVRIADVRPWTRDRELMARVAAGDATAFTRLVERYGRRLFAVAHRLLGSRADAEDAVQRALLQCYTNASSYRPAWAVSTWLYRILTNVCVDELRRRATRAAYDAGPTPRSTRRVRARPGGASISPRALARVPREARVLLALRYTDGLSYERARPGPRHLRQHREEPARPRQGPAARRAREERSPP